MLRSLGLREGEVAAHPGCLCGMAAGLGMLSEGGLGSAEMLAAWCVFSASECSRVAGKGNVLMLVLPEGLYCSPATGLGSKIRRQTRE